MISVSLALAVTHGRLLSLSINAFSFRSFLSSESAKFVPTCSSFAVRHLHRRRPPPDLGHSPRECRFTLPLRLLYVDPPSRRGLAGRSVRQPARPRRPHRRRQFGLGSRATTPRHHVHPRAGVQAAVRQDRTATPDREEVQDGPADAGREDHLRAPGQPRGCEGYQARRVLPQAATGSRRHAGRHGPDGRAPVRQLGTAEDRRADHHPLRPLDRGPGRGQEGSRSRQGEEQRSQTRTHGRGVDETGIRFDALQVGLFTCVVVGSSSSRG